METCHDKDRKRGEGDGGGQTQPDPEKVMERTHAKVVEDIADVHDRKLLDILENGATVIDKDGESRKVTPSAAFFNVARQRLKDMGYTKVPTQGDALDRMAGPLGFVQGAGELPPLSEDDDDATKEAVG